MKQAETITHDKKELALSTAISVLSNLDAGNLVEATEYIKTLLTKQQGGESRNALVVEDGAIQEMDIALQNVEFLVTQLDNFVYFSDFQDGEWPQLGVINRMLADYVEELREQLSELIDRL